MSIHKYKRRLAEKALLAAPGESDRLIGKQNGLSASFIRKVRRRLEEEGRLEPRRVRRGRDNKWRPTGDLTITDEQDLLLALALVYHDGEMPNEEWIVHRRLAIEQDGVREQARVYVQFDGRSVPLGWFLARYSAEHPDKVAEIKQALAPYLAEDPGKQLDRLLGL